MDKLIYSVSVKLITFFMLSSFVCCSVLSFACLRVAISNGSFVKDFDTVISEAFDSERQEYAELLKEYVRSGFENKRPANRFNLVLGEESNFCYSVASVSGASIKHNYTDVECLTESELFSTNSSDGSGSVYQLKYGIDKRLPYKDDIYYEVYLSGAIHTFRWLIVLITVLSILSATVSGILVWKLSGRKAGREDICVSVLHKVPFGLYLLPSAVLLIPAAVIWLISNKMTDIVVFVTMSMVVSPILVFLFYTLAVRAKAGLIEKLLIVRISHKLPLPIKCAMLWCAVTLIELFVFFFVTKGYFTLWIFLRICSIPLLVWAVVSAMRILKAGKELSAGRIGYKVNTRYLPYECKTHAEHLNGIAEGFGNAVEQGIKSERMKAELITNVSHDIKTPLTSIVNYVDLLEKNVGDREKTQDYIAVLRRQSERLKNLTEDLVLASKATTGNVKVEKKALDVGLLLSQAVGEYSEKAAERDLEMVCDHPADTCMIMADGLLMWRIFDNLLSNVCKYAKSGTRVYVSAVTQGTETVIIFKNVSSAPLNISAEELTERFVRGDSSRHTEGSGLGLSIAKSLTEIQGGDFRLDIDGDLFKATLIFR